MLTSVVVLRDLPALAFGLAAVDVFFGAAAALVVALVVAFLVAGAFFTMGAFLVEAAFAVDFCY